GSIETLVPTVWLWRSIMQNSSNAPSVLLVDSWQLEVSSGGGGRTNAASVYHSLAQTEAVVSKLGGWLTAANLSHGNVRFSDTDIHLPSVGWSTGNLRVPAAGLQVPILQTPWSGISTQGITGVMVNARLAGRQPWAMSI